MCGIVALFSRRDPVSAAALQRATQSLYHRGPDGQRHWIAPDCRVALGHARLSIIDLATGDQPIASEDEQVRIVVNGEFYGYESIQRELERSGHRLRTKSDSEIALHLYEDLGAQCLHRLRGEFAFVLWDETNRTIFAARDRFGIKPLFYAFHGQTLLPPECQPGGMRGPSITPSNSAGIRCARFLTAFFRFHLATTSWQPTSTSS